MTRVELRKSFIVVDASDLQQKLSTFFTTHKMKIVERVESIIQLEQGSQLYTRLLGGWFVSPHWYPKKAILKIISNSENTTIEASIEETLGFGFIDNNFKLKYQSYFELWMMHLEDAIK